MKIYPSYHEIREAAQIRTKDIPLAFVDTQAAQLSVDVRLEPALAASYGERSVQPYEEFVRPDPFLFSESGAVIEDFALKRRGNRYVFEPQNMVEFSPLRFSFHALVKKNMTYQSDAMYNLRVAVHESGEDLALSKKLIAIFGDAPRRGICPGNISVNRQDMTPESLINTTTEDNDFIFIESCDGVHIEQEGVSVPLDMDALLALNVNVWLSVESFDTLLGTLENCGPFEMKNPVLYTTKTYEIAGYSYYFDSNQEHPAYPKSAYAYTTPFSGASAALILEKTNGGFVVITHTKLFSNLTQENAKIVYELMLQVYLRSYYKTPEKDSWITDECVDYMAHQAMRYNLRHAPLNLGALLKNPNCEIGGAYTLVEIKTSDENVRFISMNANGDLFFLKTGAQPDPIKEEGAVSYYTTKHTVVHYRHYALRKLETGLRVDTAVEDGGIFVIVRPCSSTANRVHTLFDQTFRLEDPAQTYILCCKEGRTQTDSEFVLLPEEAYTGAEGVKAATVRIVRNEKPQIFDLRIKGGGLPVSIDPDYNMLDIGHYKGRPYRLGSTLIIELPQRLKAHEEKIRGAVEQHASSGDYPVFIYRS